MRITFTIKKKVKSHNIWSRLTLTVSVFLVSCCNTGGNQAPIVKKTYFEDGRIKSKQEFVQDSIQEGLYIEYYHSGGVKVEIPYKDNKMSGVAKEYFEDGGLRKSAELIDGTLEGQTKWFYPNGQIEEMGIYHEGDRVGKTYLWYENGNYKAYLHYDHLGRLMYRVDYGLNYDIQSEEGTGFPAVIVSGQQVGQKDTFVADLKIIDPPHANSRLLLVGKMVDDTLSEAEEVKLSGSSYRYSTVWEDTGVHQWGAILKLNSSAPKAKKEYRYQMEVEVIEKK